MPKSILQIWALFAVVLLIFICYSSFSKPFKWNFEIKQSASKTIFNPNPLTAKNNPVDNFNLPNDSSLQQIDNINNPSDKLAVATNALAIEDEPIPVVDFPKDAFKSYDLRPVVDSSSLYILLAGDSMTEELRFGLAKYCDKNGFKLMTCTWYSSNTQIWSETNRLSQLIAQYRPDLVLFTLGSNELFRKDITDREAYIQDIIYEADRTKTPFVWINPPAWKEDTGISELIKKNVGTERHFDSRGIKMNRKSDGAHPTRDGAQVWADAIAAFLKAQSYYKPLFANFNLNLADKMQKSYKIQALDTVLAARKSKLNIIILKDNQQNFINNDVLAINNLSKSQTDSAKIKNNAVVTKNNAVVTKNDSTKSNTQPTDTKNNSTEPKNNSADTKNNSTEPKNNSAEPKDSSAKKSVPNIKPDSTKGNN